jgi:ribosomal protein L11 methyltransferase
LLRIAIRVQRSQAELVLAELLDLAPSGVEEVSLGDVVEYAVYGSPGELPSLPDLRAAAGGALVEVSTEEIDDDWSERWREFHKPLVLDGALTVRPPWAAPARTPIDIVIDPGQAFGTGAHATTSLCLELMLAVDPVGAFLDLGCGSGVLAIAAGKLGWDPVIAVDNDPLSVETASANAVANGVVVDIRRLDLRRDPLPVAPTVTANLLTPLLLRWADRIGPAPSSALRGGREALPGRVIASGILRGEVDRVAGAFAECGLIERDRRMRGEWAGLLMDR